MIERLSPRLLTQDSEAFLNHWRDSDLKKKESRHKSWMEEVWLPRQRRLEEHVTQRGPVEVQRRLRLYSRFLHYCNIKVGELSLFGVRH